MNIDHIISELQKRFILIPKTYELNINNTDTQTQTFMELILQKTCEYFGKTRKEIIKGRSGQCTADYRYPEIKSMMFMLCRELPERPISFLRIGSFFGKTHATVIHGVENCKSKIKHDKTFAYDYKKIELSINQNMKT